MDLSNYSLEELQELKTELNEQIKTLREEEKQAEKAAHKEEMEELDNQNRDALSNVEIGTPVRVIYKDEEIVAPFVKLTDKRFVVEIDGDKRAIMFRKYVGPAENAEVA